MKLLKILLTGGLFLFAVIGAVSTNALSSKPTTYYKTNPDPLASDKCISQTECTALTGNVCDFTVYTTDGSTACSGVIDRRKN